MIKTQTTNKIKHTLTRFTHA